VDDWPPRSTGDLGGGRRPVPPGGYRAGQPRPGQPRPSGQPRPTTGQGQPRRTPPPATRVNPVPPSRDRARPTDRDRARYAGAPRRSAGRRTAARTARTILALVSALVLGLTWYGWSTVEKLTSGLTTADVIDPAAKDNSGPQNILLVGIDTRTDAKGKPM
jgi:hypothetical protein